MIYHQAPGGSRADIILVRLRGRQSKYSGGCDVQGTKEKAAKRRLLEIVF